MWAGAGSICKSAHIMIARAIHERADQAVVADGAILAVKRVPLRGLQVILHSWRLDVGKVEEAAKRGFQQRPWLDLLRFECVWPWV